MGHRTAGEFYRLSEVDQAEATARWVREQQKCPKCGNPRSECADPQRDWYPQRSVCFATMAREAAQLAFDALHSDKSEARFHNGNWSDWSPRRDAEHPFPHDAGTTVYVSPEDIDPGDQFVTDPWARPASVRPAVDLTKTEEG